MTEIFGRNDQHQTREEYLTIVAGSVREAMGQFRKRGLGAKGYALVGKVDRHRFELVSGGDESAPMFDGTSMVAATYRRLVNVN